MIWGLVCLLTSVVGLVGLPNRDALVVQLVDQLVSQSNRNTGTAAHSVMTALQTAGSAAMAAGSVKSHCSRSPPRLTVGSA